MHNIILSSAMISKKTLIFTSVAAAVLAGTALYAHDVSMQNTIRDYQDDLSAIKNSTVSHAFSSVAVCEEQGFDKAKCVQAFKNANKWSETNAVIPIYKSDHECEKVFSSCKFKDISFFEAALFNPTRDGFVSLSANLRFATRHGGRSSGGGYTGYTPDVIAVVVDKNLDHAVPLYVNRDRAPITFNPRQ